jgi:hypothetical protein
MAILKWIRMEICEAPMVTNSVWLFITQKIHKYKFTYKNMVNPKQGMQLNIL